MVGYQDREEGTVCKLYDRYKLNYTPSDGWSQILAAIPAKQNTKHRSLKTSFVDSMHDYRSISSSCYIIFLLPFRRKRVRTRKDKAAYKKRIGDSFDHCDFADYAFSSSWESPSFTPLLVVPIPLFSFLLRRCAVLSSLRAALYSTLTPT